MYKRQEPKDGELVVKPILPQGVSLLDDSVKITVTYEVEEAVSYTHLDVYKRQPLTGVTLPFVAYGGTSILASFIVLAMVQLSSIEGEVDG